MSDGRIQSLDRTHLWHPYTQHALAGDHVEITRASGAYLYDATGRRIFDAISSWWVTLHGHAHPVIARAVADQASRLEQVIFAGFTHEPAVLLAADLVRIVPEGLTRVFYTDDGSTAVEVALKMALQYWENAGERRRLVLALEHAYHGDTFGAMSVSARGVFTAAFGDKLFDVVRLPDPSEHDVAAALEQELARRGGEIAAVIVEPMLMGAGGMRMWTADALRRVRQLTRQHDVFLIADEVLTGFGRTGPLFACNHAGITPDILCLSKGLTGGFLPLGATLASERLFQGHVSNDRARTLFHGHSFTANPIACAAARASIALLGGECDAERARIERAHRSAALRLSEHARVRNARVLGTVLAFEVDGESDYLDTLGPALREFALERGVLIRPLGNTVYFLPPYAASDGDLSDAYGVVLDFLDR
ncbi:MAG TPA: adenosylmethionine--8-amino-7-oxononanoate transaminase [Gemmatimonadaceae bacterium]|nr:adenosylmethionine--8-amino-7-oxononanoate transaminase [Gemmatimonadaceae bacterium]